MLTAATLVVGGLTTTTTQSGLAITRVIGTAIGLLDQQALAAISSQLQGSDNAAQQYSIVACSKH
jgi:hypothetical protein